MPHKNNIQSKPKSSKIKIRSGKSKNNNHLKGGDLSDDIIDKDDFDDLSGDERKNEEDIIEDEEQRDEDDDILRNEDYGDEEQKDVIDNEQDIDYDQGDDADGSCLYKFAKKNITESETESEEDDQVYEDDVETKNVEELVDKENRETKPILTKYERVRILGDRAKQLSLGAKPMLLNVENMNPKDLAKLELERGVIPFILEKVLPDGKKERWKINELKIVN